MERKKNSLSFLLLLLLLFVVAGCRTTKKIGTGNIKGDITLAELSSMPAFLPAPMNISSKLKLTAEVGAKTLSASGTLGIEEDKGVGLGITALGLFEIARIEITPQTALVINKVDNEYASINYSSNSILQQAGLNYDILQAVLLNVPFTTDGSDVLEALTVMDITRVGNDITLVTPQKGTMQYTFLIDAVSGELQKTSGTYNSSVKVNCEYRDFTEIEGRRFPREISLVVDGLDTPLSLKFRLSNIKEGKYKFKNSDTNSMKQMELNAILDAIK